MRGIGSSFSRLPRVAAWLAGAAILAGALSPRAFAASDEVALAVPRLAPLGGDGVALPEPLAAPDAALLRRLFAQSHRPVTDLLHQGAALDRTVRLNDEMVGHLLASRYLGRGGRPSAAALADWLARYPTLPDAAAIASLKNSHGRTTVVAIETAGPAGSAPPAEPAGQTLRRNALLDETIQTRLHNRQFDSARSLVSRTKGLRADYAAVLRAEIAQGLFADNQDEAALALAAQAARDAQGRVALADYVAGLASWRLQQPQSALTHFAAAAVAPIATPGLHAAAAYWTARACIATGDKIRWPGWLDYAARDRASFYGQIAARQRGLSAGNGRDDWVLGEAEIAAVQAEPAGLRAFALLQIGQDARAEAELRQLAASADHRTLTRAIMLIAQRAGLTVLATDLAAALDQQAGRHPEPIAVPHLHPRNGFLMDPALVYAVTRIESNFDPAAVSAMGAQGLMQLMPNTAGAVAHGPARLRDPSVNLDLGQRYLAALADADVVDGDLIRLLASYNSGPAAFARWSEDIQDRHDPLLFIEAIPNAETRSFVQQALTFTWLYAARLHLPTPSLDAIAEGRYPRFSPASPIEAASLKAAQ